MAEMESDINGLDADLQAKVASLKLAHTRLENRTNRPGVDLCRDEVLNKSAILSVVAKWQRKLGEGSSVYVTSIFVFSFPRRCSTASWMKSISWRPPSWLWNRNCLRLSESGLCYYDGQVELIVCPCFYLPVPHQRKAHTDKTSHPSSNTQPFSKYLS